MASTTSASPQQRAQELVAQQHVHEACSSQLADSIEQQVRQMSIRKQHLQSKAQVAESEQLKEKEVLELFGI